MSDQQHMAETSASADEQPHQQFETMQARPPLPGEVLAAERQARGWSVEYVASHLKLATRQIQALEEDRYDALPGMVVIRGFIRIYAKMLGVDSTALVAALPVETAPAGIQARPSRALSTPFSESSLPLRGRRELPIARLAWVGIGVVAIAGIFGATKYGVWSEIRNSSLLQRLHVGGVGSPGAVAAVADRPESGAEPVAVADSENSAAEAASATHDNAPAPAAAEPVAAVAAAPEAAIASPAQAASAADAPMARAAVGVNPLQLKMRQDAWVEIRRADKTTMISRVFKAGTTESFDIAEPVSMTIGNAAGVEATLRGQPLSLASATGSNVARLNLK
jgi:cytoskeleton protein RodZ